MIGHRMSVYLVKIPSFLDCVFVCYCNSLFKNEILAPVRYNASLITSGQNMCFYGVCTYCRKEFPACAKGDMLEGSMTLFLPLQEKNYKLEAQKNPWIRTYEDGFVAK